MNNIVFVNKNLENIINNVLMQQMFPKLIKDHRNILSDYLIRLINIIAICFDVDRKLFHNQLIQNNYQDLKWLLLHLLPFINSNETLDNIASLNDIFISRTNNETIDLVEPTYKYSNIQYGRVKRNKDKYDEIQFDKKYLDHNFYLLIDTIKIMSHKMHLNWIDILPYDIASYRNSNIFEIFKKKFTDKNLSDWVATETASLNKSNENICEDILSKYNGLDMNDIYNVISNDLYHDIKGIKWLLYDVIVSHEVKNSLPIIAVIDIIFPNILEMLLVGNTGREWNSLSTDQQNDFEFKWNDLVTTIIEGYGFRSPKFSLSSDAIKLFMKGIISSFDKSYKLIKDAIDNGNYIPIPDVKQSEHDEYAVYEDFDEDEKLNFGRLVPSIKSVKPMYIYDYLRDSLQKYKNTWYGSQTLNDYKNRFDGIESFAVEGLEVSYKNLYNYAKSLTHYIKNNQYLEYPKYWCSLTTEQKQEILDRLNDHYKDPMEWFNISRNIKYSGLAKTLKRTPADINLELHSLIREKLPDIIFLVLIRKGVLTHFSPNENLTNKRLNDTPTHEMHKKLNEKNVFSTSSTNKYWVYSYHFLTGVPFYCVNQYQTENEISNIFKYNSKNSWYASSSLDWVAQIGFCHHFINNRVTFITGATGVGKSTLIPYLFMYNLKAIDYLNNGKVVCTQPRITPTINNATRVSLQIGVPIFETLNNGEQRKTKNYYVQMQHQKDRHTSNVNSLSLKFITDGSLLLEVNNPILTIQNRKNEFTDLNIYDILIIDEAHEHNANMDMLLTLLKSPISYNNSLRLVILSATMDEDEPRYRRFYRDINDNRKYPINTDLKKYNIDRINIDRRFHISPPGMTTRFDIKEFYLPKSKYELRDLVNLVMNIIKKHTYGDILIFQAGERQIMELVEELNKQIPKNIIALPYYSRLNEVKKKYVENISNGLKYIKMEKTADFNDPLIDITKGTESYDRAILVATNIAEASLTIETLTVVIETGKHKVNVYDYRKRSSSLIEKDISESSRIQRKGRLGRTQAGTVYYLYNKGQMENNKIAYSISIDNLTLNLFQHLKTNCTEKKLITDNFDVNDPKNIITINQLDELNIKKFILSHYFIDGKYYDYFGNNDHYDYENYVGSNYYYESGYSKLTLSDKNGKFYLIHPDELVIKRNINGDIVSVSEDAAKFYKQNNHNGYINSYKMNSFWNMMDDYMYITTDTCENDVRKTNFGSLILSLKEQMKIDDHSVIRSLIFGKIFNCEEDMIKLMSLYLTIGYDIKNLIKRTDGKFNIDSIKKILKNDKSDSECLLEILNDYHNFLTGLGVNNDPLSSEYLKYLVNPNINYNKAKLLIIGNKKELSKNKIMENVSEAQKQINEVYKDIIKTKSSQIKKWCDSRYIESDVMNEYMLQYLNLKLLLLQKFQIEGDNIIESFKNIFNKVPTITQYNLNNLTISLLLSYPFNVCKLLNSTKYYLSLYTPSITNIYKISSFSRNKYIPKTFVNNIYLSNYILYTSPSSDDDTMALIHYINPKYLSLLGELYYASHFSKSFDNKELITYIENYLNSDEEHETKENLHTIISLFKTCINELESDCKQYYNNDITSTLKSLKN